MKNNKIPTKEMVSAAKSILVAKSWENTVRIIVEKYEKEILERNNFQYSEEFSDLNQGKITDIKNAWMMKGEDFAIYHQECKKERDKAGLEVNHEDNCPLLEAEGMLRKAQGVLIDLLQPITGITREDILGSKNGLENYNKMVDLALKWIVSYCKEKGIALAVKL